MEGNDAEEMDYRECCLTIIVIIQVIWGKTLSWFLLVINNISRRRNKRFFMCVHALCTHKCNDLERENLLTRFSLLRCCISESTYDLYLHSNGMPLGRTCHIFFKQRRYTLF